MKFIDMFCGIGTARLAFEYAGHQCVSSIEIDKYKRHIYKTIFGEEPERGDIKNVFGNELPRSDVWVAGFPCQDISIAGRQLGITRGFRSNLFFEIMRLLQETKEEDKPSYLLFENVKNLYSVNDGRDFLEILYQMDEVGYDAEWDCLNSKFFGVPQNRERVFIVGHLRGRGTRKVFPIERSDSEITKLQGQQIYANTLKTRYRVGGGETYIIECEQPSQEVRAVLTPDRANKKQNGRRFKEDGEPMFTLTNQDRHGVELRQLIPGSDAQRVYDSEGLARTLKSEGGGQGAKTGLYQVESRIRRLTPRECFRLQAIPEYIIDKIYDAGLSDTQMYRGAGEAWTVAVGYEIAKRMEVN